MNNSSSNVDVGPSKHALLSQSSPFIIPSPDPSDLGAVLLATGASTALLWRSFGLGGGGRGANIGEWLTDL